MTENSRIFLFSYDDLKLQFELYTKKHIENELKKLNGITVDTIAVIPRKTPANLRKIYLDSYGDEKYHFFAYIKFFLYENEKYGIVGGKTNYPSYDICFDKLADEKDNRIARMFLKQNDLEWDNEVLIINHAEKKERRVDELQAIFIERYLQRKFNLFDS